MVKIIFIYVIDLKLLFQIQPVYSPAGPQNGWHCDDSVLVSPPNRSHQQTEMLTVQLPQPLVLTFLVLSSTLWLTTIILLSGLIRSEENDLRALQDFMFEATGLH